MASPFLQVPGFNCGGANDKFLRLQPSSMISVSRSFPDGLEVEKKGRNELTQMDRHSMSPCVESLPAARLALAAA
jgi:hypothetical protein